MSDDTINVNGKSDYDPMYEEFTGFPKLEILLTRNEALFIDDSLSMIIEKESGEERLGTVRPLSFTAGLPAPIDLLEKLGKAILFTTDPENNGELASMPVTETDLYMLREITHSYVKIGDEPVGYNLKRKIYILLYGTEYSREKVAKKLIAQLDIALPKILDEEPNIKNIKDTK